MESMDQASQKETAGLRRALRTAKKRLRVFIVENRIFLFCPMEPLNPAVQNPRANHDASQQPPYQVTVVQHHHHHNHYTVVPTTRRLISQTSPPSQQYSKVPAPLFAGKIKHTSRQPFGNGYANRVTRSSKPIGAAYTYNWRMWRVFGCATLLRCTAGWFCLFFAICGILFILWLAGILWICIFIPGFCEIKD